MTKQSFLEAIRTRLKNEGLPDRYIDQQCEALDKKISNLPPETEEKYFQDSNVGSICDRLILKYKIVSESEPAKSGDDSEEADHTKPVKIREQKPEYSSEGAKEDRKDADREKPNAEPVKEDPVNVVVNEPPKPVTRSASSDMVVIFDDDSKKKKGSALSSVFSIDSTIYADNEHPKLLFALIAVLLAPIGILLALTVIGVYIGILAALAGLILGIVGAVVAISGIGSLISVGALLYGATQVISVPRYAGIYEIGFGLLVGGITMFVGIVLYNIALRLVPFLYSKLLKFIGFSVRKLRSIFKKSLKGCEKL